MRVLITGICGFVGSTLARGLREGWPDWQLVGVENFVRAGSEQNRLSLRALGVKIFHGDIRSATDLEALPKCDWIIDAAANPSVLAGVDGKTSSRQLIEHNLVGTVNLLERAKAWNAGFLMLSTSRVYSVRALAAIPVEPNGNRFDPVVRSPGFSRSGPPDGGTPNGYGTAGVTENFSTEPPLSLYGTSKRASELLALEYADVFNLPVYVNRCGVLAGLGQFGKIDQGIFSFWIHSYKRKRPLKYIGFDGSGRQVRDCLHARDLLPLLAKQMTAPRKDAPRVINVSGGLKQSASLKQLSDWCAARFGETPIASDKATRPFDVPWLVLDSTLAEQTWGWQPQTSLEGIWNEIAGHAEANPHWLDLTVD